jgi:GH18 family chitinase
VSFATLATFIRHDISRQRIIRSLKAKLDYAKNMNLGGIMVWAIDQDDDQNTLLKLVGTSNICGGGGGKDDVKYKCSPIDEQRWWTAEDDKASCSVYCQTRQRKISEQGWYVRTIRPFVQGLLSCLRS